MEPITFLMILAIFTGVVVTRPKEEVTYVAKPMYEKREPIVVHNLITLQEQPIEVKTMQVPEPRVLDEYYETVEE
jgi:hypothetical protein